MKVFCLDCGCHFKDEFAQTYKCDFWIHRGCQKLTWKQRKQIWDWIFSFDYDKFAEETGISLNIDWSGQEYNKNEFEQIIPAYKNWDDKTRREFQKEWFSWINKLTDRDRTVYLLCEFFRNSKWESKLK